MTENILAVCLAVLVLETCVAIGTLIYECVRYGFQHAPEDYWHMNLSLLVCIVTLIVAICTVVVGALFK